MIKSEITIELLERGDIIFTPSGLAQVTESEELQDYINAGSYYKMVKVRWLETVSGHSAGFKGFVDKGSCIFDWKTKLEDIEKVKKYIKK